MSVKDFVLNCWRMVFPIVKHKIGEYMITLDIREGIQRAIYLNSYEPVETKWVSNHLKEGDIFVDAGANIGYYSLLASQLVGETGKVFSFEPAEQAYTALAKSISTNNIKNIHLITSALGDSVKEVEMFRSKNNIFSPSFVTDPNEEKISIGTHRIITLDSWAWLDGITKIDFLKIDVEGYEQKVITGAKECLTRGYIKMLMIEITHENRDSLTSIIESHGFELVDKNEDLYCCGNCLYMRK